MLMLPPSVKLYMAVQAADMRKSFNGLTLAVQNTLKQDPFSGHLFIFFNKRRDQVRILFWDRSGFCILAKRLEKGCFKVPAPNDDATHVDVEAAELGLILEGIDLHKSQRRNRWEPGK